MSIEALALNFGFRLLNFRKLISNLFRNPPRNPGVYNQEKTLPGITRLNWDVDGFSLVTYQPDSESGKHLIFLHGGGYILEANPFHWKMVEKLARIYQLSVSLIDYPKAPEYTFQTTHQVLLKAYKEIINRHENQEIILLGDSAGGGMALSLLQVLRENKIQPYPDKTILLSPWVDLTMKNPEIPDYAARDFLLPLEALIYAAKEYSGGEDLNDPRLSPLYGDMADLGSIMLVYGTEEILYPDCKKLEEKLSKAPGTFVETILCEGWGHDWVVFPLRKSRSILLQIGEFIQNATN
jgi:monoterpene epsilon-lactone hydrolase